MAAANPAADAGSFIWFRDGVAVGQGNDTFPIADEGDAAAGEYACARPQNFAGVGPRCSITVSARPVGGETADSALAADASYAYAVFGGVAVVVVFAGVLLGALLLGCSRRGASQFGASAVRSSGKYALSKSNNGDVVGNGKRQRGGGGGGGSVHRRRRRHDLHPAAEPTFLVLLFLAAASPLSANGKNGHYRNGRANGTADARPARVKRVTVNSGRTSFEFEEEDDEEDFVRPAVVVPVGPATRVLNAITRTCELGNVRAPKELWLV